MDTRHKNDNWIIPTDARGQVKDWAFVPVALLMDIRDELQTLNRLLSCSRFLRIPTTLDRIQCNTAKKRKTRK